MWEEPPLRDPVPSFQDYKGLERAGVLEHMAPLGHAPPPKVKARVRPYEPPRRGLQLRNGEVRQGKEDVSTPEPMPPFSIKAPESHLETSLVPMAGTLRNHVDGSDAVSGVLSNLSPAHQGHASSAPLTPPTNSSVSTVPNFRDMQWEEVVQIAVRRCDELGNKTLGSAIRKLYEESLQSQHLAILLNAVLSQTQTDQQAAAFQVYIKRAKKEFKHRESGGKLSTPSVSDSSATNFRDSAQRQTVASKDPTDLAIPSSSTSNHTPLKRSVNSTMANGSPAKNFRPAKRPKRSRSTSTDSSLSSLGSAVEDFAPGKVDPALRSSMSEHTSSRISRSRPAGGPRVGSFSSNHLLVEQETPESRTAVRKLHQRGFDDYSVEDSDLRTALAPPPESSPQSTALQQRAQHPRRKAASSRHQIAEDDTSESPLSSQSESSLPPPPSGFRGITPQLGRPPKTNRKVARIKQS